MGLAVGALFLQIVTTTLSVFDHVVPIKRHLGYTFRYKSKVEKLKEEVRQLGVERESLQHSVDEALRQGNDILNNITDWQTRVGTNIQRADLLIQTEDEVAKKRCFFGVSPNLKRRYLLGKKADKEASGIAKLIEEKGRFDRISYRPPLQQIVRPSVPGYTAESREVLLKKVIEKLLDPSVYMVGVYGMGGIGKTTLANDVQYQAKDKLFNVVVMVEVTAQPQLTKIRDEIAELSGLELNEKTEAGRASRLYQSLKKRKILIILDNLWEPLDLEKIGIPTGTGSDGKDCKILLTSRSSKVLSDMGSIHNIRVEVLPMEEAMSLFQKKVDVIKDPEIAEAILFQCHGFPLLIVTMAGLLKNESLHTWKDSLTQLSRSDNQELEEKVYSVVTLSYDRLGSETKLIFLLYGICSQSETTIPDLLKYCWGLCLFKHYTLEQARNRLNKLIDDLIASSLLLDVDKRGYMKMHDTVRRVALRIACTHQDAFRVEDGIVLKEWPIKDDLKNCTKISMPLCEIQELPEDLECPLVEFFLLFLKGSSPLNVPDSAFEHTRNLKVLHFKGVKFSSVPGSFRVLTNLHTLCLDGCHFCNVSIVGELKKLEILSFRGSKLEKLPDEIGQLTKLKLLDLSYCSKLKVIPANVLSKLSALEELLMRNSFNQWEAQEHHNRSNASLTDLECLSQLTTFEVRVPDAKALTGVLLSKKLERYQILVGDRWMWDEENQSLKTMKLKLNTSIDLLPTIKKLLKETETLKLQQSKGVWGIFNDPENGGFPKLKKLYAQGDSEVQHIVDYSKMVINGFPVLESLELHHFASLVKICHRELAPMSFSKLRKLVVCDCKNLKHLLSISMVRSLSQLEKIAVSRCHNMDGIVVDESDGSEVEFPRLHTLSLKDLPKLKGFALDAKSFTISETALGYDTIELGTPLLLFDKMVSFPSLEILRLDSIDNIENIWHNRFATTGSFSKLTSLSIDHCTKLKNVFPSDSLRRFQKLKSLSVRQCNLVEEISKFEEPNGTITLELTELDLEYLPKLKHIWREENTQPYFTLENLELIRVRACELMKYLFPPCVAKRLPKLEVLSIWSCGELKEIIKGEECGGSTSSPGPHTTECPQLKYLAVIGCDKAFSKQETCGEWQNIPRQQHFLLSDEVFSNLEEMSIDSLIFKMILQSPSPMKLPTGLKSLELQSFRGRSLEISTSGVGLRLPNLQKLCVTNSSLKELFRYRRVDGDERDTDTRPCSPIKCLELNHVEGLRHILRQDSQMDPLLPYLETMELRGCKDLISLSPLSSASFWNLTTLVVSRCEHMTNLMKPSTAKTMTRVVEMRIYECVALKEIIVSKDDQDSNDLKTQEEIIFNKLTTLELINLENLTGFCMNDSVSFKFPSLEKVTIKRCSNMRIFCHGELNAPKLKNINSGESDYSMVNRQWKDDLNSTIRQLYEEMVGLQWHSEIKLSRFPRLIERWHGGRLPFQHICRNLNNLAVDKCAIFSIAVPSSLLPFSNKLTKLVVEKCELVEDVFDLEGLNATEGHVALMSQLKRLRLFDLPKLRHIWNEDPHGFLGIRNLTELKVHNCGSLTNIFTLSMALGLDRLKWLEVTECALVEEIIKNVEDEADWNQQTIFPSLCSIKLEHLPNLRNFYSGEHILKCPELSRIYLVGCPKMSAYASTSSARKVDSSTSVHEQEERPCEGSEVMPTHCFFNGKVEVLSLRKLKVEWNSGMTETWNQLFSAAFLSGLEFMKLIGFPAEPTLVPPNFLYSCPNLKMLVVGDSSCDSIFPLGRDVPEKNDLGSTIKLATLHLFNLPMITNLVEEEIVLFLSQHLKNLKVIKCDGLKQLVPYNASFQNLENLEVSQCNGLTSLISHSIARSLVKLKNMIVKECNTMRAIVASEGDVLECDVDFSHLKYLKLYSLSCLTSFSIGNGAFNFQDLKTLEVSQCNGLRSLLSHSIAKGLVKLEKMIVKECNTMRAIVASEGDDVVCDVDFGCLKHLELCHLPCLTSFSFGNVAFNFPCLGEVIIKNCPNMKIFCNTIISTSMLDEVQVADDEDGWRWEGSLNGTIAKLFMEMTINQ